MDQTASVCMKFVKMHGLGNDFVVIDGIRQNVRLTSDLVRRLADRHFGIGCDQVLVVEAARGDADFRYRIFNQDGSEVAQCGNGARCFAKFVREEGLSDAATISVETDHGRLVLAHQADGTIRVDMGVPQHAPAQIPLAVEQEAATYMTRVMDRPIGFGAVSMGNPHAVLDVPDIETAPVASLGPAMQSLPLFPASANIGFMQIVDPHRIKLRVYERGAGETLACGSGACAAAVVGIEQERLRSPVRVDLPGGSLDIHWAGRGTPVAMIGPATRVFEGTIDL